MRTAKASGINRGQQTPRSQPARFTRPRIKRWTSARTRLYQSAQNHRWLSGKETPPLQPAMKTNEDGKLLLCSYNGERVMLPFGSKFARKKALVSYPKSDGHKIHVEIKDLHWEFSLRYNGTIWLVKTLLEPR